MSLTLFSRITLSLKITKGEIKLDWCVVLFCMPNLMIEIYPDLLLSQVRKAISTANTTLTVSKH